MWPLCISQCCRGCTRKCTCNQKHLLALQEKELQVDICAACLHTFDWCFNCGLIRSYTLCSFEEGEKNNLTDSRNFLKIKLQHYLPSYSYISKLLFLSFLTFFLFLWGCAGGLGGLFWITALVGNIDWKL